MFIKDRISLESVISRVIILRHENTLWKLPEKEHLRLEKILDKIEEGCKINVYDDVDYGKSPIQIEDEKKENLKKSRKRKLKKENGSKCAKSKVRKLPKIKKRKVEKTKRVDKSNPNWRLIPKTGIAVWESDPLFETKVEVPFVSSISHSKLAIRAVLMNNMKMLKTVVNDTKKVHNPNVKRSLGNSMSAMDYALKFENMEAVEILSDKKKMKAKRVDVPICSLDTRDTGKYNYR